MVKTVSEANGCYAEILKAKNERLTLTGVIANRTDRLIKFLRKNGPTLVYKDDLPVMVEAVKKVTKKLDKTALGAHLGVPANSLNAMKIAKLVETGKLTSFKLAEYEFEEEDYKLKMRKAKKDEVQSFRNRK